MALRLRVCCIRLKNGAVMEKVEERGQVWGLLVPALLVLVVAGALAAWVSSRDRGAEQASTVAGQEQISNSIAMALVKIPGGTFVMGEAGRANRLPTREVTIAPFYIGIYEVTQAQWQAVMGYNPSEYKDSRRPVEQVSWLEVQSFLEELNRLEGTNRYRLPTEAEWEYAARAGSLEPRFFGEDVTQLRRYAAYGAKDASGSWPVGRKAANPWGLFDVYGNVWEWVQDCWHDNYNGAPASGRLWAGGDCAYRVMRGGGWNSPESSIGSAVRGSFIPNQEDVATGFRVVRNP